MSAVLAAVYGDHAAAERVRTRLVNDGFPTDRVELTSCQELGRAGIAPAERVSQRISQYFQQLFPEGREGRELEQAVLGGRAVVAVQPRGETETQRALEILDGGVPVELAASDLGSQTFEYAAAQNETPAVVRLGKILVGN